LGTASKVAGSPPPVQTFDSTAPLEIPRRLAGKRVLVIDDELDSRTLLTHTIQEFGCQAISSASGEEGLRMAREFHPDLISVDLMMPGLDGWQVIAALKADLALCHIPVVVVSIVAGENKGGVLGAVEVLQKPVNRSDLLAVLHRCLPIKNPRILVVDDEEDARRVLVSHLEEEPCELRLATSGHEALEILKNHTPDLVLLDLMMPVMDGMAFLNHLRSNPRLQFLPVVIVTAKELSVAESDQLRRMTQDIVKKGDVFEADLKRVLHRFLSAGVASATKPEPP
jgi:CheY-like chemotaxis protein